MTGMMDLKTRVARHGSPDIKQCRAKQKTSQHVTKTELAFKL